MKRYATNLAQGVALVAAIGAFGCGGEEVAPGAITADTAPANSAPVAEGAMGHGTHDPKHGGVVLMSDAYHFEVVANAQGQYEVYFTDMARNDLPASTAQSVTLTVKRPSGESPERIPMTMNDSGDGWKASGTPVADMQATVVNISYLAKGAQKPYAMDIPLYTTQPGATAPGTAPAPGTPPPALARPAEQK